MDKVSESGERRNRDGLAFLTSRYIRRAEAVSQQLTFRDAVVERRQRWNDHFPAYRVVPVERPRTVDQHPHAQRRRLGYLPDSLAKASESGNPPQRSSTRSPLPEWYEMSEHLCRMFWLPSHYPSPPGTLKHPALTFVSACFFEDPQAVGYRARDLITPLKIEPQAFPYEPERFDRFDVVRLTAERDRLLEMVVELLVARDGVSPDEQVDTLTRNLGLEVSQHGEQRARDVLGGSWGEMRPEDWWWHIPLTPGLSIADLEEAAPRVVEYIRSLYGKRRLDALIIELRNNDRKPQQEIADLLGVSITLVKDALRDAREGGTDGRL